MKNSEATVEDAVSSILSQDFPMESMELVVVDGYSKDRTIPIIKENLIQADLRKKFFYENLGLGQARQTVVTNSSGSYIIWVDGDMELPRNFIQKQVKFMSANPKAGIGKGKYGLNKNDKLVANLENMEFLINFHDEGETDSKSLGTSGCIYRLEAIRQAGGFDPNFKGVGEDMDAEYRIRQNGWKLCVTDAIFYEKRRDSWRSLWDEYFWHGYGWQSLLTKNRNMINIIKLLPPIALLIEFTRVPKAYRLTYQKAALLLPFHYCFKRIAWFFGFIKSRM